MPSLRVADKCKAAMSSLDLASSVEPVHFSWQRLLAAIILEGLGRKRILLGKE
jgi:hypothetical protein